VIIYLCHKYSGARLKEIGERFGVGESAVSQISKRFVQKMNDDAEIKKMILALKERLRIVNV
jgi:putative transposase